MNTPGIPSTRWFDATLLDKKDVAQKDNIKAMIVIGHGGNTVTRMPEAQKGIEKLELLVVADPHPTTWAALAPERKNDTYLLPIATSFETTGSRTASNRSIQWGEQIVKPIFESKDDNEVMYLLAKKLGFADQMFKNIKVENNVPVAEDILREINRGGWSTGYCGQSPERLKSHMANQKDFDLRHAEGRRPARTRATTTACRGRAGARRSSSIPARRCSTTPTSRSRTAAARSAPASASSARRTLPDGTKRKVSLLGNGSYSKDSEIKDGYPEFTLGVLKKLGWDKDLTEAELAVINKINPTTPDAVSWSIDLSGGIQRVAIEHGCIPYGNGKARANAFGLPDAIPMHREPIYTPRPELVAKYPTLPNAGSSACRTSASTCRRRRWRRASPSSSRSSSPPAVWSNTKAAARRRAPTSGSPSCSRTCSSRSILRTRPSAASRTAPGSGSPAPRYDSKARMKALVTERVGKGVTWCPFHFAGWFQGVDQRGKYPKGADPIVLGESVNTLTTYGFDPVTGMQEPKATLCQIRAA